MRKDRTGVDDAAMIIRILPRLALAADGNGVHTKIREVGSQTGYAIGNEHFVVACYAHHQIGVARGVIQVHPINIVGGQTVWSISAG